ncbi:hypothetical protein [Methylocapsa palsarum]|uniref:Uncharacterized protein n=1 Tax=Methylocapsa palsarum TaxID=1612308 RepID=A0A1I3XQX7_9HYPH|nr:hypothetical protein [Methylocapsa palsarum]SFK21928.1 hypothetical protein SAMN05444581_10419 [Methylocapsa palsarum]
MTKPTDPDHTEGLANAAETMPTPQQRAIIERYLKRRKSRPHAPRLVVKSQSSEPLAVSSPSLADDAGLALAFGTTDPGLANTLLKSLISAACDSGPNHSPSEKEVNGMLAAVHGVGANDEIEAMLAVQMVATHFAATRALRRLKGSDTIPQQDSNGNLAVKLLRTFAAQTEALQRYRGKGQQKVTVEHVHVHTGARAIVGTVSHGGRDHVENRGQPHGPQNGGTITFAPGAALLGEDETRDAVPVASGQR